MSIYGMPDWARKGEVTTTGVPFSTTDTDVQVVAVRQGLGMTTLPCQSRDMDSPARSGAYAASLRDTNSVKSRTRFVLRTQHCTQNHDRHVGIECVVGGLTEFDIGRS